MNAFQRLICWLASPTAGSFFILLLAPLVALSAEQTIRSFETEFGTSMFLVAAGVVQVLWAMGYCASSLPKWAKWSDGTRLERYEIVAGIFGSACAGNILFYAGVYTMDMKLIHGFVAAIVGGFAGDKVLTMITDRYVSRASVKEGA